MESGSGPQGPPPSGPQGPAGPQSPSGHSPPTPPGQASQPQFAPPTGYVAPAGAQPNAPGAVPALVLGILGLVICPLCGPFAWWQGRSAEDAVEASGGQYGGKGMATAGKVLGIIGTVVVVLVVIVLIVAFAAQFALHGGSSSSP